MNFLILQAVLNDMGTFKPWVPPEVKARWTSTGWSGEVSGNARETTEKAMDGWKTFEKKAFFFLESENCSRGGWFYLFLAGFIGVL